MSTPDYVQFGEYLKTQRELRALSLDEIAAKTKIPPTLIGALESGQSERFPERIFVLNYIRSYAGAVGLSPDDAVNRFHEIPEAPRAEHFDPKELELDRRQRASTMMWSTVAVILVVGLLVGLSAMYDLAIRYTHR